MILFDFKLEKKDTESYELLSQYFGDLAWSIKIYGFQEVQGISIWQKVRRWWPLWITNFR